MSLLTLAESDLSTIVEDSECGFGQEFVLTTPTNASYPITGLGSDVGTSIDPDTGVTVSGRTASISVRQSTIKNLGVELPTRETKSSERPWVVTFFDRQCREHKFTVLRTYPDNTLGLVVILLELYV